MTRLEQCTPTSRIAATLVDDDTNQGALVHFETPAWADLLEWCKFHGIDPMLVPADTLIQRHGQACKIIYTRVVLDADGRRQFDADMRLVTQVVVEQGEAPPLPFPPSIEMYQFPKLVEAKHP